MLNINPPSLPPPVLPVYSSLCFFLPLSHSLSLLLLLFVSLPCLSLSGNDVQMIRAWNAIGDYYADRRKWYRPYLLAVLPALHSLFVASSFTPALCCRHYIILSLCVCMCVCAVGSMLSRTMFKPATWRGWLKATTLWRTTPTWPSCQTPFPTTTSCLG